MNLFRKIILLAIGCFSFFNLSAQKEITDSLKSKETTDTISVKLQEVVVEGRTQRVIQFGVEYIPDKKTKRLSQSATDLLAFMHIPQLRAFPGSTQVTTLSGQEVKLFIDYVPATPEDLTGMRPEDVLRVEVLDYPDDPRFQSEQHVVNFIMVHYNWGGYTKLYMTGTDGFPSIRLLPSIYSKFAVNDKWVIDANAYGNFVRDSHKPAFSEETFRDVDYSGVTYDEIKRVSTGGNRLLKKEINQTYAARACYIGKTVYLQQQIYFGRNGNPDNQEYNNVNFSIPAIPSSESYSYLNSQSLFPGTSGYYWFSFPHNNSLVANWSFQYASTKIYSSYQLGDLSPIININKEKTYSPNINLQYSKRFTHNNTFRVALMSYNTIYDTQYRGSYTGNQKLLSSENMMFLEYMQNWQFGLSLYSRAGMSYVVGRLNGVNELEQWNPRLGLQLQYRINDKNSASLEGWWGNGHPSASTFNDALVQSNELMWLQGNPDLRNVLFHTVRASYNYIPTNKFSMGVNLGYTGNPDKFAYEYYSLPGYNGLIRKTINSGNAHEFTATLSASLRLLDNSLVFSLFGNAKRVVLTGIDAIKKNMVMGSISAQYMRSIWSLMLVYQTPQSDIDAYSYGVYSKLKDRYGLIFNLSLKDFKISVNSFNWFRKGGTGSHKYFDSSRYSFYRSDWNFNYEHNLVVTLSYVFNYGKKISHNDELGSGGSVDSAILK